MKKLVFADEKFQVELAGQTYELRYPTWGETEGLKDNADNEKMKQLLISVGLPLEALNKLQLQHLVQLVEELTGVKKN